MPRLINSYSLEELQGDKDGIIIRTQEGTELLISVEHDKTLVLFPFGNKLESPELIGHLSKGVMASPVPRAEPVVRNAVPCGICQSGADRYEWGFQCQANPNHMGDLVVGIFTDMTYPVKKEVKS